MKSLFIFLFIISFVLNFNINAASGGKPIKDTFQFSEVDTSCGFPVNVDGTIDLLLQSFSNGDLLAIVNGTFVYTNLANDKSTIDNFNFNVRNKADGTIQRTGQLDHLKSASEGNIVISSGKIVYDQNLQVTFQSNNVIPNVTPELCASLQ